MTVPQHNPRRDAVTFSGQTVEFPAPEFPEPAVQKLLGLYAQTQDGLWMQRVKVPGGRIEPYQWGALADILERFVPGTPLHLTTRQDVEIHNLRPEQVPALQAALAEAGLTTLGAAGDTYRNITVCPCAGVLPGSPDLMDLAGRIEAALKQLDFIVTLPRKFKITLACSEACGQPWINDMGFVAVDDDGRLAFRTTVAGSLGAKPGTGILLFDKLPAADVVSLVVAAVTVFNEHGDRENRRRARLRHVRERMGDDPFRALLLGEFEKVLRQGGYRIEPTARVEGGLSADAELIFANGDVTPRQARALGRLAEQDDIAINLANPHKAVVFGPDEATLNQRLDAFGELAAPRKPQPVVVACPGNRWCAHGLVDTGGLADRIRGELADLIPAGATVCISGCPNGCAHPAVADYGLTGVRTKRDGQQVEAFNLAVGGGMGRTAKMAEPVAAKLTADEVLLDLKQRLSNHKT